MPRFPGMFSGKSNDTGLYRKSFFRYPVRYSAAILEKWMDPFRGWIQRIGRGRFAEKRGLSLFPVLLFSRNGLRYIILLCPPRGSTPAGTGIRRPVVQTPPVEITTRSREFLTGAFHSSAYRREGSLRAAFRSSACRREVFPMAAIHLPACRTRHSLIPVLPPGLSMMRNPDLWRIRNFRMKTARPWSLRSPNSACSPLPAFLPSGLPIRIV